MPCAERGLERLLHAGVERLAVGPERRRLERLDQDADVEHRVAEVRRVEAAVRPGLAGAFADRRTAQAGEQRGDRGALRLDRGWGALVAGDHQAAAGRLSADLVGAREIDRGLGLVGEAEDGRQHPGLGQRPHRVGTDRERRPAPPLVDLHLGQLPDPHGHLGDHAEGALRAEEQLAQVRAGGVRRGGAEPHLATRRGDARPTTRASKRP